MTDQQLVTTGGPAAGAVDTTTDKPLLKSKSGRTLTVTGKNRRAVDAMVWQGLKRAEAAASAGLTDHSLYVALSKPHVKAYYLQQCEVLRLSGRARRIHRLETIAEQDENKQAAVNAIKVLDQVPDSAQAVGAVQHMAGVVIVIADPRVMSQQSHNAQKTIDIKANEHGDD